MALGIMLSIDYIPHKLAVDILPMIEESFTHVFIPELWGRDALTQVAALASITKSNLTYGTAIVNTYSRSPATLAQTAASLSELTEGRFILGLGLSGPIVIQNWHGIPFYEHSPLQRTREYFEIIRLILSGERCNYTGEIFQLQNFKLRMEPEQVPLFLAALGPKNIQLTGEIADGWFPIWAPLTRFDHLQKDLEVGKKKRASNLSATIDIAPIIITCASDSPKAKLLAQKHLAYYVGGMGTFYNNFMRRLGFENEAKQIQTAWRASNRDLAAANVSDAMIEEIAAIGKADEIIGRYEQLRKKGITIPVVMLPFNCPPDLAFETIQCFSS